MKFGLTRTTLDEFFDRVIEKYATRPSLAFVGETPFTYAELGRRVKTIQNLLTKLDIQKGDPIVLLGNSSPNWATAFLAIMTRGAVAVPILEGFPETDIDHIIRHSEAKAVFIEEDYANSLTLPSLERIEHVVNLTDFS
ncbi:MAG: AMP-binding protein, partial [Calditrichaeota bacterium]|nr:AMP-binding protein [Calditrichota bacterium]